MWNRFIRLTVGYMNAWPLPIERGVTSYRYLFAHHGYDVHVHTSMPHGLFHTRVCCILQHKSRFGIAHIRFGCIDSLRRFGMCCLGVVGVWVAHNQAHTAYLVPV